MAGPERLCVGMEWAPCKFFVGLRFPMMFRQTNLWHQMKGELMTKQSVYRYGDPNPDQASLGAMNMNWQIGTVVFFNFVCYFGAGLPLAVIPGYVHGELGYSVVVSGAAVSLQYLATLFSRLSAGKLCDTRGPKHAVIWGLAFCAVSGIAMLLSGFLASTAWQCLASIFLARLLLGTAESLVATGSATWAMGVAGPKSTGKVISWNGIASYVGIALGAPAGVLLTRQWGWGSLGVATLLIALAALVPALRKPGVMPASGTRLSLRKVFAQMCPFGVCLALGSAGFGAIIAFIALYYASMNWENGALALSALGGSFILGRLVFSDAIARFGGYATALYSLSFEVLGLALLWLAPTPSLALLGVAMSGFGFSLYFRPSGWWQSTLSRKAIGALRSAATRYFSICRYSSRVRSPD
jgi:MFS family permease